MRPDDSLLFEGQETKYFSFFTAKLTLCFTFYNRQRCLPKSNALNKTHPQVFGVNMNNESTTLMAGTVLVTRSENQTFQTLEIHKLAQQTTFDNLTLPKTKYTTSHQTHKSQHKRIHPAANKDRNGARGDSRRGVGLGRR